MDLTLPPGLASELPAALLQAVVTAALAVLFWALHHGTRKDYLRWWGLTWSLYTIRMGAILAFFLTESPAWLFWHQVLTGWTALALLGAALAFGRPGLDRKILIYVALFPVAWSYVAIYRLDQFLLAAGPAVVFLSIATVGAAWAFWSHHRRVASRAALFLALTLAIWALHHLDYPFLRARGAWAPWGYYLDLVLQGATGFGILLLVLEDHRTGLKTLSGLAARILERDAGDDFIRALLGELCVIPGVDGAALVEDDANGRQSILAVGSLEDDGMAEREAWVDGASWRSGDGTVSRVRLSADGGDAEGILIPVVSPEGFRGWVVVAGRGRHGLLALSDDHLLALGQQIGIAMDKAALTSRLLARTGELERLAAKTVGQHEAERKRISRELHDETAQALAAVRMRLAVLGEELGPESIPLMAEAVESLKEAIASIRRVTSRLRPLVLDELGLLPALRALARDFTDASEVTIDFQVEGNGPPSLPGEHELTLFRCLQEGLANAMRHADASVVNVRLSTSPSEVVLVVHDDGDPNKNGAPDARPEFGAGLTGMRERVSMLGGSVRFEKGPEGGRLAVHMPLPQEGAPIG